MKSFTVSTSMHTVHTSDSVPSLWYAGYDVQTTENSACTLKLAVHIIAYKEHTVPCTVAAASRLWGFVPQGESGARPFCEVKHIQLFPIM